MNFLIDLKVPTDKLLLFSTIGGFGFLISIFDMWLSIVYMVYLFIVFFVLSLGEKLEILRNNQLKTKPISKRKKIKNE